MSCLMHFRPPRHSPGAECQRMVTFPLGATEMLPFSKVWVMVPSAWRTARPVGSPTLECSQPEAAQALRIEPWMKLIRPPGRQ